MWATIKSLAYAECPQDVRDSLAAQYFVDAIRDEDTQHQKVDGCQDLKSAGIYEEVNEITIKDSYPLPRIDDTLDALNGSQWFSTLDLKSGYWQVEIQPEEKKRPAFTTGQGLWQFKEPEGQIARWIKDCKNMTSKSSIMGTLTEMQMRSLEDPVKSCKHCTNAEKKFGMETDISVKALTTEDAWSQVRFKGQLEDLLLGQFWRN
ncbi:hypothetical protein AVEN_95237-1 [Araneus ventricosus]|uniref:Reverse transcriptase domain-containing protein n=1 Tax=Araneus ventricosus TaxID=182803 RepID=A0A4Y2DHJ3_ARAVE|nr:hypothetical protein AVEN_95237-1 [Araneus ventricosus]